MTDKQSETKFPSSTYSKPTTTKQDRDDWFRRCLSECPAINDYPTYDGVLWEEWFEKWFGQFKEDKL